MKSEKNSVLLEKANKLPLTPGVYIMKDRSGKVIYVGKSRKLKARVSQYFQSSEKNIKTAKMVASVADFEYILCETEIEALTLENTLIKQYSPRYNIRLKDAKSYPYIKVTSGEFPKLTVTRQRANDKALYFGPYSSSATAHTVVRNIEKTLGLPNCKRVFPRDIGKERPCIYLQMGKCCGVCNESVSAEEYRELIRAACDILRGKTGEAKRKLEKDMFAFADQERYEAAARCRDTLASLNALSQKQHVVMESGSEADAVGFYTDDLSSVITVMYIRDGALTDKSEFVFGSNEIAEESDIVSFLCRYYQSRTYIPKNVYLSFEPSEEERELLAECLTTLAGYKINVRSPKRGTKNALCELAQENAAEKAKQFGISAQKDRDNLLSLTNLLKLESFPERIEAYDISNLGQEQLTAGMIVIENGEFKPSDYRVFKIKTVTGTDDYASMREALSRRFAHLSDETGSFAAYPDLILLDGGKTHVATVRELLASLGIDVAVYGMVKDDRHRTRALTSDTEEFSLDSDHSLFVMIYKIQEEVHRFTISRMQNAKEKSFKRSSLENIKGIGKTKARALLAAFDGVRGVKEADVDALAAVKGITKADAQNIYAHFHGEN